jgi:LysM repeat protein
MALAVLLSGCSGRGVRPADDAELQHPLIRKAIARERAGDREGAVQHYREAVTRQPTLARAHLGLALLLDQPGGDHLLAIYHYTQYLTLRPQTEKRELIEDRIRMAKISFASAMFKQPVSVAERISSLEAEVAKLKTENGNLTAQLQQSRLLIAQLRSGGASAGGTAVRPAPLPTGDPPGPRPAGLQPAVRTYRVEPGDTLTRIAVKMYNDREKWRAIFEANRSTLREPNGVKVGQTLIIP